MNTAAPSAGSGETLAVAPGGRLSGRLRVPGDKSISHRALLLGALAEGTTDISGFLASHDCLASAAALRAWDVRIDVAGERVMVRGVGLDGLRPAAAALDVGNAGTGMRLLAGIAAGQSFTTTLTGDASLRRRPMARIIGPLRQMGATIDAAPGDLAPLTIQGARPLRPLRYRLPVASAQLKSALLLAGLYADGETACLEPAPSRDHTEKMLEQFGVELVRTDGWIGVRGGSRLRAATVAVPGDFSSAAFFLVGASIAPDSDLLIEAVGINPTRTGLLTVLREMGARIDILNPRRAGAEPVADLRVRGAPLHGIEVPPALVPLMIDEFPALLIAAACAEGETTVSGAGELRVKESDRIAAMADGLVRLGVAVSVRPDGLRVRGIDRLGGGEVDSLGDHRIAMAFAVAGLRAGAVIRIADAANVATSFPGFAATARAAGLDITIDTENGTDTRT